MNNLINSMLSTDTIIHPRTKGVEVGWGSPTNSSINSLHKTLRKQKGRSLLARANLRTLRCPRLLGYPLLVLVLKLALFSALLSAQSASVLALSSAVLLVASVALMQRRRAKRLFSMRRV